jgi:hypothetical protein
MDRTGDTVPVRPSVRVLVRAYPSGRGGHEGSSRRFRFDDEPEVINPAYIARGNVSALEG